MPTRVLVIGVLFCLGGVTAVWDVIEGLTRSSIRLNVAVFLLPVGIGLLRGKRSSQWWAKFWIVLGCIGCGVLFFLAIVNPESCTASWFGTRVTGSDAVPFVLGVAIGGCILLWIMQRLLSSPQANAFFGADDARDARGA